MKTNKTHIFLYLVGVFFLIFSAVTYSNGEITLVPVFACIGLANISIGLSLQSKRKCKPKN